jgi:hypothetical protein
MSGADGLAGQEFFVVYLEAIDWIAFRDFSGRVALPLEKLARFGVNDDDVGVQYGIDIGSSILAEELLLDYVVKGRIRVYAKRGWTKDKTRLTFPIQLTPEILAKAEFALDKYKGPMFFIAGGRSTTSWLSILVISSEGFGESLTRSRFQKRSRPLLPTGTRSPPTRLTCAPTKLTLPHAP